MIQINQTRKHTIEEMQNIAKERRGECLSDSYINNRTRLMWRCSEGHEWEAIPSNILKGHWCPYCAGIGKSSIKDMQKIAQKRGGECLSNEYVDSLTKLKWRCSKGHEWEATPNNVKNNKTWCLICSGSKKGTIEEMKLIAKKKGGECLSLEYISARTNLKWRCADGHEWESVPYSIKKGHWCPYCAGSGKLNIEEMHKIARDRNGKCLSQEYINARTNLKWRCADGHEWKASPDNIKRGKWCPYCSVYVSEKICRETFERLFEKRFPKKRPKWLINPETGKKMELDGYCEDLKLAFEYQGKQHYEETYFTTRRSLLKQIKLDKIKKELCDENDVKLIEITYNIEYDQIPTYIISKCQKQGISVPNINLEVFDYHSFDIYSPSRLEEMHKIARERGGKCLSDNYINANTKLKWRCSEGHDWESVPASIKAGTWCPYCHGNIKLTIQEMQEIAKTRGGECLSDKYINSQTKLKWRCRERHEWEATPNGIVGGKWCPYCAGIVKLTIEEMQEIAKSRGGECLSSSYININSKLKWRCSEGHEWEIKPGHVKNGSWCPYCAGSAKLTIEEMQEIAKSRGGECLSQDYINARTNLKWRCGDGHEWEAVPHSIKRGRWCPICAKERKKKR